MADIGHKETDKILAELEKKIANIYRQANKETQKKLENYLDAFKGKDEKRRELVKSGKITKEEYNNWRIGQVMTGRRWAEMSESLAEDYHNANKIAVNISKETMPDVYALNHNYGTYQVEKSGEVDTSYTLYDRQTVENLIGNEPDFLPPPKKGGKTDRKLRENKDLRWNKQKINSAVTQGILQGEPIIDIARRLRKVGEMNYNASIRNARTMTTGAENAGRYAAYRRADKMGIDLTIEWQATLDGRTRHEHRMMHGQRRNIDEPFEIEGIEILYPGQATGESDAPQNMIWNCRCTLLAWVKGFEGKTIKKSPKMGNMNFEQWQKTKPNYKKTKEDEIK